MMLYQDSLPEWTCGFNFEKRNGFVHFQVVSKNNIQADAEAWLTRQNSCETNQNGEVVTPFIQRDRA